MANKTPEEILKSKLDELSMNNGNYPVYVHWEKEVKEYILEAMEEYAAQFKQPEKQIGVLGCFDDLYLDKIHFAPIITNWLEYKAQKNQRYKPIGLKTLIKKFNQFEGTYYELESIVENSIMNNYSGIIWKTNKVNGKSTKPTTDDAIGSFLSGQVF